MSQAMSVKIGPTFFAKEFRDYRDWRWAYVREAAQNGIDAPGSSRLDFTVSQDGDDTRVSFQNDGEPMDEEALIGKLLTMGESGKNFQSGATGGFGKAKLLLLFAQQGWSVRTGTLLVEGSGGEYTLTRDLPHFPGTRTEVTMAGDQVDALAGAVRRFCQLAQWSGTVRLNGEVLRTGLRKGHHRRDFSWCTVHTNRQHENLVVVRINGTPMFTKPTPFRGCVVVELTGNSGERLSANRDSLLYRIGEELDAFLLQLAVDKRSALRQKRAEVRRFEGERLRNEAKRAKVAGSVLDLLVDEDEGTPQPLAAFVRGGDVVAQAGIKTEVVSRESSAVTIGPEFFLQNTTGMVTPDYYVPGPTFSDYSRKLALAWAKCLLELHRILEVSAEFSIGFVLDEDCGAQSAKEQGQQVYYINPATLVAQRDKPQCRSFKAAFTGAWADRFEIISLALHEIVHGAYGLGQHDEEYSTKLTEITGVALAHLGRLTPLFRG